jgi:hypothetical protein
MPHRRSDAPKYWTALRHACGTGRTRKLSTYSRVLFHRRLDSRHEHGRALRREFIGFLNDGHWYMGRIKKLKSTFFVGVSKRVPSLRMGRRWFFWAFLAQTNGVLCMYITLDALMIALPWCRWHGVAYILVGRDVNTSLWFTRTLVAWYERGVCIQNEH